MNKGDINLIEIPTSKGHEQEGLRPGIIFSIENFEKINFQNSQRRTLHRFPFGNDTYAKFSNETAGILSIVPFTTQRRALDFNFTLELSKSNENGLQLDSIALVFQLRAIDKKRIKNKVGILEDKYLYEINKMIKEMLLD